MEAVAGPVPWAQYPHHCTFPSDNFLCDEKVKPVNPSEEDGESGRDRPQLTEKGTLPTGFRTTSKAAPTRSGDAATRMALRMMLDNKRQYRPLFNLERNTGQNKGQA